jgi:lipid-A-disaccharide synthase
VIRELIQDDATESSIADELERLLHDEPYRGAMLQAYDHLYSTLDTGSASENAARLMIKYLKG